MKRILTLVAIFALAAALPAEAAGLKLASRYRAGGPGWSVGPSNVIVDDNDFETQHPGWGSAIVGPGWRHLCGGDGELSGLHCGAGYKDDYHYITRSSQDYSEYATWKPQIPKDGMYQVWVSFVCTDNRANDARYTVFYEGGFQRYSVNQLQGHPEIGRQLTWCYLGTHPFKKGGRALVKLSNNINSHSETADAVGFRYVAPLAPAE